MKIIGTEFRVVFYLFGLNLFDTKSLDIRNIWNFEPKNPELLPRLFCFYLQVNTMFNFYLSTEFGPESLQWLHVAQYKSKLNYSL